MINLIKNELIKILKKKSTYIVFIITIIFIIFANFMNRNSDMDYYNSSYYDEDTIESYKSRLPSPTDEKNNYLYVELQSKIHMLELIKKYGFNSWQAYVIENKYGSSGDLTTICRYEYSIYKSVTKDEYEKAKKNYDEFVQRLDADDWRYFVTQELDGIKNEIAHTSDEETLHSLNIQKQVLEWRLEKGISYASSFLNTQLDVYSGNSSYIYNYNQDKQHNYNEKLNYYRSLEELNQSKYYIENNISWIHENDNRGILISLLNNYELFILIFIIMIAGSIVADEFSKGTIKLLLVRPYNRAKILLSKFLVCIIVLILFIAIIGVAQFIIGGIIQGFSSLSVPALVYNYNTNQLETMNIVQYITITALAKLPMYILLMTLAFSCSTIFTNSAVSIVLPLLGYMGSEIINQLAHMLKWQALLYFVTPNWDLTQYLFGNLPDFQEITLPFSIAVCSAYFILMMVVSFMVFKKRNIKNI